MRKILLATSRNPSGTLNKFSNERASAVALAALASVSAFAQSSVTISGGMTLGVGSTKTGAQSTGTQITRQTGNIQFAGVEDLGGGLKAGFQVQTTLGQAATDSNDTTTVANRTMLGDRAANMYLTGAFGTAVIGRVNTPTRSLMGLSDVSGLAINSGLSAGAGATDAAARVIYGDAFVNAVAYVSPSFNGVTATVATVPVTDLAANTATQNKDIMSYTLQYANGPLNAAVNLTDYNTYKQTGLFANYDFGIAKVGFVSQSISNDTGVSPSRGNGLTLSVPMGAGSIGAGWGKRGVSAATNFGDNVKQTFVGYRYNLSKRTNVQLVWNKIDREGATTTADVKETQLQLAHTF